MKPADLHEFFSRRAFGRQMATLAGAGFLGASAVTLAVPGRVRAADEPRKGYFDVNKLPFHLQHEFAHAISCNNAVAKTEEIELAAEKQHAVLQRPGSFGWGTITFFLNFDPKLVGKDVAFFSTVGWQGKAEGEVVFSVEINGDIVIDGSRSKKNTWAKVERTLPLKAREMRLTLMLDSIRGNNDFSFWWGEPQLRASK